MDKHFSKVPTAIALGLSALSFALVTAGWITGAKVPADIPGIGSSLWIFSVIAGAAAVFVYYHDAVRAARFAKRRIRPVFNTVRTAVLFLGIPMFLIFGLRSGWNILIWNGYHLLMCAFDAAWLVMTQRADHS